MPRTLLASLVIALCLVVNFAPAARAQQQQRAEAAAPIVIAVRGERGVRFTSPAASEIRLELFSEAGERVFDSEYRRGSMLDWSAADHSLHDGSYLFVVTVRDVSGRLRQRHATAHVQSGQPVLARSVRSKFTAAQTRAWEASRAAQSLAPSTTGEEHVIVLSEEEARALVVTTHDGADGHVTSTTGALTFRTGDVLAGRDQERMRITPDGKVGVGTSEPQTALDVEGEVRATEGIRFGDGTTLSSRDGKLVARDASGEPLPGPSAAGTGTQNHVAKWAETGGAGTLTNSTLFESGGNVGIGTTNPASMLHLAGPNGVAAITFNTPGTQKFRFQSIPFIVDWGALTLNSNYDGTTGWFLDDPSREGWFFKLDGRPGDFLGVPNRGLWLYRIPPGAGAHTDESPVFGVSTDRAFFAGNVGVGKTSPTQKLDVDGNINATGDYRINGIRALAVTGTLNSNTFVGRDAGSANTTGSDNTFVGRQAGLSNTIGNNNTFVGSEAGIDNTTGNNNAFFGRGAGRVNTTGSFNAFFGSSAGVSNTTGNNNAFFGAGAGSANTTGTDNSFFGNGAGQANTTGNNNAFFGRHAGFSNTTGLNNSFFGFFAGRINTTGSDNSFFGTSAGFFNSTGSNNSFFGKDAGLNNTEGSDNAFFGRQAGFSNGTGNSNAFFGRDAGRSNSTGNNNSFFGRDAGFSNTSGGDNSFFGTSAGRANTTGVQNAFFGFGAGFSNNIGSSNSFFGSDAGVSNTSGNNNAFFGTSAGTNTSTGSDNSFFGMLAGGFNTTGFNNSFFGKSAGLSNTTGNNNTFFGMLAGQANTEGSFNSFFGRDAGFNTTTGTNNSIFGRSAGFNNSTGSGNTIFGSTAGQTNTTGNNNSFFGSSANSSDGLTNATAIGHRAFVTQSNSLVLGSINGVNGATASTNIGIGVTAPARRLHISDAMRLEPVASAPANPSNGDMYFNSSQALCIFINGAWAKITGPGTCQ